MKKLAVTLSVLAVAAGAFAQGSVSVNNSGTTLFSTNGAAVSAGTGSTSSSSVTRFFYEVLTAPSTVTTVDSSLQALLSGPWSDTSQGGGNSGIAGRENGLGTTVQNWAVGVQQSFVVVGWSANLGTTWAQVSVELSGATLSGGKWTGGSFSTTDTLNGYLGATVVGVRQAGGVVGTTTIATPGLFGSAADAQGTPITTGTALFVVPTPEPTSMALAGLGIAAGLVLRRRK